METLSAGQGARGQMSWPIGSNRRVVPRRRNQADRVPAELSAVVSRGQDATAKVKPGLWGLIRRQRHAAELIVSPARVAKPVSIEGSEQLGEQRAELPARLLAGLQSELPGELLGKLPRPQLPGQPAEQRAEQLPQRPRE